jgi:hypothetical protein
MTRKLNAERAHVDYLERMYRGDHDLPSVPEKYRDLFRRFLRQARTNYLSLVVEAPLERMQVTGFRIGDAETADDAAWKRWQAARLDSDQVSVHRSMLALRRGYTMVGRNPRTGAVIVTPEHPSQVITESYPEDRREVRMGLKLWLDDITGNVRANLYATRGEIVSSGGVVLSFEAPSQTTHDILGTLEVNLLSTLVQEWRLLDVEATGLDANPLTVFENRPNALGIPRAEFEDVIPIQDRINATMFHRLVAEAFGSFRQKAILNYVYDEDPDGQPIPPELRNDPGTAWIFEAVEGADKPVSLFEFSQTDTSNIIAAAASDVRDLASISRTPPHYLLAGMVNVTGDALKAAETGLVAKVRREHHPQASDGWELTAGKMAALDGDTTTDFSDAETLWADPESRTMAELYDAAVKAKTAGVPWRARMEMLGYSPQAIDRMEAELAQEAMLAALAVPLQDPAAAAPGAPPAAQNEPAGTEPPA